MICSPLVLVVVVGGGDLHTKMYDDYTDSVPEWMDLKSIGLCPREIKNPSLSDNFTTSYVSLCRSQWRDGGGFEHFRSMEEFASLTFNQRLLENSRFSCQCGI